ncbi:beta-glucosidase [Fodinibius roseus]|uniref:Beta-glucosidase n=1 Tax=Fodinibius roseus TaxID=1194090 RepID=A0A1M4SZT5_9BACT|nr:glycoside hydrolase family 3 protein [Fodinibius roseus]SHE37673.1 beta-glucosidase [Fodinibius roseus]
MEKKGFSSKEGTEDKDNISRRQFLKRGAGSAAFWVLAGSGLSSAVSSCAPENSESEFSGRVEELIAEMSPEEKISQLRYDAPAIPRLDIPKYNWWNECLHGVGRAGYATVFPQAMGMAATWNAPLFQQMANAISDEARAKHQAFREEGRRDIYMGLTFWTPNINIVRDPRWGRGQETYGEDPYLTGSLANSFINGLQGEDPDYHKVVATSKHFAVYSGPEPLRHEMNVEVSDRDLWDTYLPAFETTIKDAGVASVMCAYNSFRGMPCCGSDPLMKAILRNDWGFEGYVVSDCWAINDFYEEGRHGASETAAEAAALALQTGTDLNCGNSYPHLQEALERELITEEDLDNALHRLFEARFKLGLFEDPEEVPYSDIPYSVVDSEEHRELALQAARESMVLLKNEPVGDQDGQPVLPLDRNLDSIAVIGPNADNYWTMLGNYHGTPALLTTALAGIQAKAGDSTEVSYAEGCRMAEGVPTLNPVESAYLTPAEGEGDGLYAEYFDNRDWEGEPQITRVDSAVDFVWRDDTPVTGKLADYFSVRWTGQLEAPVSGRYTLGFNGFNGYRLSFEGEKKIERDLDHEPWHETFEVDLEAGGTYDITIEYFNRGPDPRAHLVWQVPQNDLLAEAKEAARSAEAVILCLGLNAKLEGEEMDLDVEGFKGGDRTSLSLPAPQIELMKEIYALDKPVVLVLMSGSALAVNWADEHIPAILHAWYGGQAGGRAIADVLFGDYNPGGRLPVTFYKSVEDLPDFTNYDMDNRTYRYLKAEPLYAFGHGLSYTYFEYDNLSLSSDSFQTDSDTELEVGVEVTNTGEVHGDEVVQLYIRYPEGGDSRLNHALKGYHRISLDAGQSKTVTFRVNDKTLAQWNEEEGSKSVPGGRAEIRIGRSSDDIVLTKSLKII